MRKLFLITASFIVAAASFAQKEDSIMIRRISDEVLTNGKAYDNLRYLTKQIGGRLAGSPGMVKAEKWGFKTMSESGADKTWLQECMVPHWVRGGKDEVKTIFTGKGAAIPKTLDVIALGNSMGSGSKGVKAEVLLVNSFNDLEEKKDQVKGKIVFYNYKFNPLMSLHFYPIVMQGNIAGKAPAVQLNMER
ncbi:MAG: hypothetical protein WDO71_11855 [Bacteroidota bacterium]